MRRRPAAAALVCAGALQLLGSARAVCDIGQQPEDPCLVMVGTTCAGPICAACPVGTYSPEVNEAVCIVCPADSSTEYPGASTLNQCECNRGFNRASPCADPAQCSASPDPATVTVRAIIRDFLSYATGLGGHADFGTVTGPFMGNWAAVAPDMVKDILGSDGVPVYNGDDAPGGTFVTGSGKRLTSKAVYDQWYRDTLGVNFRLEGPPLSGHPPKHSLSTPATPPSCCRPGVQSLAVAHARLRAELHYAARNGTSRALTRRRRSRRLLRYHLHAGHRGLASRVAARVWARRLRVSPSLSPCHRVLVGVLPCHLLA